MDNLRRGCRIAELKLFGLVQRLRLDRSERVAAHSARSIFRNTRVLAIGVLLERLQTFRFRPCRPMEINSQMTLRFRTDPVFLKIANGEEAAVFRQKVADLLREIFGFGLVLFLYNACGRFLLPSLTPARLWSRRPF